MPLSERARLEAYLPDLPTPAYQELLTALEPEFTYTFGGCTLIRNPRGNYQSRLGFPVEDRANLLITDIQRSGRTLVDRFIGRRGSATRAGR